MRRKRSKTSKLKNQVKFVCTLLAISFIIIYLLSALQLTKIPTISSKLPKTKFSSKIGEFGETVIKMLPENLKFTLFLPSEIAFHRDLRLNRSDESGNTYAVLTRVLGFSAVPRWISTKDLGEKEMVYDSISGLNLYVSKDFKGNVIVNGLVSENVDVKFGNVLVHVMDGVVMDAEFQLSMLPDDGDDE